MSFHTKIVGVTFEGRQRIVARLRVGEEVKLVRDPYNSYDSNAIKVVNMAGQQVGFLSREIVSDLARKMDRGHRYKCTISSVTGGNLGQNYGANVLIEEL
jgi:single-stranded-DNA-specific exonuclease